MNEVIRRAVGAVEAEVDGERILLSPKDYTYFRLGGAGAPVWDKVDGVRTFQQIVSELETEYSGDSSTIWEETERFIEALAEAGLVVRT